MTLSSLRLALLAGLALPFGLASASVAQTTPPPAAGAPMRHHWADRGPVDPAARRAHMAEHLAAELQLQPGQQTALSAFLDSMTPPASMKDGMDRGRREDERLTTPQRLDKMLAHFDEMHARMVARVQATKQFYAQLSPSQQKAFDALGPRMMRHFGGDRHGGMGHRHGGGPGREMGRDKGHEMGAGGPPPG
jgi:hypothetical protein